MYNASTGKVLTHIWQKYNGTSDRKIHDFPVHYGRLVNYQLKDTVKSRKITPN